MTKIIFCVKILFHKINFKGLHGAGFLKLNIYI